MIRTLTLNPAVDRTVTIERFAVDAVNRVADTRVDAGGKGINVSKALKALGCRSVAYGFLAGQTGRFIREYLDCQGLSHCFVELSGETRTNLKIVDPVLHTHTDVNEKGPPIGPSDLAKLEGLLFADLGPGDVLILSGSVGNGVDPGIYGAWTKRARSLGALVILDADGPALAKGVDASPTLLKPNIAELERLSGTTLSWGPGGGTDVQATVACARDLLSRGIEQVVVSLGHEGALFVEKGRTLRAHGIKIEALSTVGAGDSLVAALARGLSRGDGMEKLVIPAMAAGTAAAATAGSAPFDPALMASFEAKVVYERLEESA